MVGGRMTREEGNKMGKKTEKVGSSKLLKLGWEKGGGRVQPWTCGDQKGLRRGKRSLPGEY